MIKTIEQTREEKIEMYMKFSKKNIIEMLINCYDVIVTLTQPTSNIKCDTYQTDTSKFCEKCKSTH